MRVIKCPNCQAELPVDFIAPGTRIECAMCDHKFILPEDEKKEAKKVSKSLIDTLKEAFDVEGIKNASMANHAVNNQEDMPETKPFLLEEEKSNDQTDKSKKQNAEDGFVFGFGEVVKSIYHVVALLFGIIGAVLLIALLSQERLYEAGYLFAALLFFALAWLSGYFALCWLLGIYRNVLEIKKSLTKQDDCKNG
jgi:ribosomal protein S27E